MNNIHDERPFHSWGESHEIGRSNDGEDDFVLEYFKNKKEDKQRLVVDIGAADGLTGSNSRRLIQENGWKAILVEPYKPFNSFLKKLYEGNENVVIHDFAFDLEEKQTKLFFKENPAHPGFTSLILEWENSQNVETKLFNHVINENNIDFLSIDTEGKDLDILKTIDFQKYNIEVICVEKWNETHNEKLHQFLSSLDYQFVNSTTSNFIFVKK
jgi:hypothetical protein